MRKSRTTTDRTARPSSQPAERDDELTVETSSGNVFADLGLPDADELLAKAELAITIRRLIESQGLTQAAAARLLGTTQPKISGLFRGRLDGFSMERLYRFLNALGQDVRIVVRPKPRSRSRATIRATVRAA
jgi:predicted XRE-type DNA-binding protein